VSCSLLISASWFHNTLSENELIQVLRDAVMQWVIGSQPSYIIPIKGHMRQAVELGVGHLKLVASEAFQADENYPVYIDEPLVVLSLMRSFEEHEWTRRLTWLQHLLFSAPTKSSVGFIFEEMTMMLLMEKFGGKFTTLGDVFNFHSSAPLKSREVALVSLTRMPDGVMSPSEASWTSGSSDRFGLKAQSVEDVLAFFADPKGKCFLFPHNHMGPDVICFLKDKETSELIILLLEARARATLDQRTWDKSIQTVTPMFFYTTTVRVRHFTSYLIADPSLCTVRKRDKGQHTHLLHIQTLRRI
jgi:hypothetical protein